MIVSPLPSNSSVRDINLRDIRAAEHAKRLAEARNVSRRYALIAASLALLPLPVLDLAAVLALQVKMVHELSKLYNVSFNYREVRPLLISLLSGCAVSGSGIIIIGMGMAIPGLGTLIGGGLAGSLSGSTLATGEVFIRHFEAGGTLENIQQSQMPMLPSPAAPPLTNVGNSLQSIDTSYQNASISVDMTNSPSDPDISSRPVSNHTDLASSPLYSELSSISEDPTIPKKVNINQIYGIGSTYQNRLHLAGIEFCDELLKLDPEALCAILGQRVSMDIANDFLVQARALIQANSS